MEVPTRQQLVSCTSLSLNKLLFFLVFVVIQKLVLSGRMGDAISTTQQLYPGLLERKPNLMFMLKCRQFVEMINGSDDSTRKPIPNKSTRR